MTVLWQYCTARTSLTVYIFSIIYIYNLDCYHMDKYHVAYRRARFSLRLKENLPQVCEKIAEDFIGALTHSRKKTFIFLSLRIPVISTRWFAGTNLSEMANLANITGLRIKYNYRHGLGKPGSHRQETRSITCNVDRLEVMYSYFICNDSRRIFQDSD